MRHYPLELIILFEVLDPCHYDLPAIPSLAIFCLK